jgi:type IV pilus assembly protein PilV
MLTRPALRNSRGTSLIEVLVTLLILSIGLLGVAGLQSKMGVAEIESYQREQALLALEDMVNRISANPSQAASYVTASGTTIGTGDTYASCTGYAVGWQLDQCQWSQLLKGSSEQTSSGTSTSNVGGMQNARGCITQVQAPNPSLGVCTPGIYQVTVVWQGTNKTGTPTLVCGMGSYGGYRRAIASVVTLPTTSCF